MSRCDFFQAQILDGAPGSEALADHLRSCAECRDLQASHRAALGLRGTALLATNRVDGRKVLRRLGAASAVAASLVAALVLWPASRMHAPLAVAEPPQSEARAFSEADAIWTVFWAQRDLGLAAAGSRDPALLAFGPLGEWVAPGRPQRPMTVVWIASKEE